MRIASLSLDQALQTANIKSRVVVIGIVRTLQYFDVQKDTQSSTDFSCKQSALIFVFCHLANLTKD